MNFKTLAACLLLGLVGCDEQTALQNDPANPKNEAETSTATKEPSQDEAAQPRQEPKKDFPPPWANRKTANSGFPCDVEQVLAESCRRCHWDPVENDAPFSLVKWEDTRKQRSDQPIFELMQKQVQAELMPPLEEMVDPPVQPLTAEQKKVLLDWLGEGAPRSDQNCL